MCEPRSRVAATSFLFQRAVSPRLDELTGVPIPAESEKRVAETRQYPAGRGAATQRGRIGALCAPHRSSLAWRRLTIDGSDWRIGAAVGVAVGSPNETNPEKLLASADHAMYAAKAAPRRAVDDNTFVERYGRGQHLSVHPDPTEPQELSGRLGDALSHLEKALAEFLHEARPGAVVERAVITQLLDTAHSVGCAVRSLLADLEA